MSPPLEVGSLHRRGKDCPRTRSRAIVRSLALAVLALGLALVTLNCCTTQATERPEPDSIVRDTAPPAETPARGAGEAPSPASTPTRQATATVRRPTATVLPPLAASVNGVPLLLAEFEARVQQFEQALLDEGIDADTLEGQAQLSQIRRDLLESLIDNLLIEQAATELGLEVGDDELDAQVARDIADGGGQEAFDEWLRSTGQTGDDYRQLVRQSMLSQRVMDAVTAGMPAEAEQVHAYLILVDSEGAAAEVLSELAQGMSFTDVARNRSLDPAAKDSGGDLGWCPRGLLAPELDGTAFALEAGQTSGPLPMGDGYVLLHVAERETGRALSSEAQAQLREASFYRWLEKRRSAADIERFVGQ